MIWKSQLNQPDIIDFAHQKLFLCEMHIVLRNSVGMKYKLSTFDIASLELLGFLKFVYLSSDTCYLRYNMDNNTEISKLCVDCVLTWLRRPIYKCIYEISAKEFAPVSRSIFCHHPRLAWRCTLFMRG